MFAVALALCVAAVAHAEDTQTDTHGIGISGNWPTSCTPGGVYQVANEAARIVEVWQETGSENCVDGLTQWHATLELPPGDWTVRWVIDARDGSEDRRFTFFVRDRTILRHHTFLPIVQ